MRISRFMSELVTCPFLCRTTPSIMHVSTWNLCYLATSLTVNSLHFPLRRNLILHMVQHGTALWVLALAPMLHILLVAFCTFPLIRFISFSSRQLLNLWTIDNFHNYEPCFIGKMYFKILNRLICKIKSNIYILYFLM